MDDLDHFDCFDIAKLLESDVTKLLSSGISPLALVAKEISNGIASKSLTISMWPTIFVLLSLFCILNIGSRNSSYCLMMLTIVALVPLYNTLA